MIVERNKEEIMIKVSSNIKVEYLQNFLDFLAYQEATCHSKATQKEVDILAKKANQTWWAKNKNRFIK